MIGRGLPQVPDPSILAKSGADSVKAVAEGLVGVGIDIAAGVEQILFNTIERSINSLQSGAKDIVQIVKSDIDTGRTTVERVKSDIDRAASTVLQQVDRGIGQEVVNKFKNEVEKQLR